MLPSQPHQSLIDGLECFQWVISSPSPVGVRELSRMLEFETTRVHRMLKTLSHLGFVQQLENQKYTHGPAVHVLSSQILFASDLTKNALKYLPLLENLKLNIALGVIWRDHISYIYHGAPGVNCTDALGRAGLFPASDSSIGLVLLSNMKDADIRSLYKQKPILGHKDDVESLLKKIHRVRALGYAIHHNTNGHTSIGVSIGKPAIAGLAAFGKISPDNYKHIINRLQEVSKMISSNE